jgi:hypothetical protein
VSRTPAKNLSQVLLTPVNNLYFPGVVDTVQKKTKKPKIYRRCQQHCRTTHWSLFEFFSKIRRDICELMFITGVNDTGDKLFSGVNDTGEKFVASVADTGEKFISPVSLIPFRKKTKKPKIYRRCQRHRRKIVHRCQQHR